MSSLYLWYYCSMCEHLNKKPYYYGYMTSEFIKDTSGMVYGGYKKLPDLPDYFCIDCLEDIFESN